MPNYRYGRYVYGPDPLALPFDVRGAVDEMGDAILAGANPADALRELLRRGFGDRAGRRGLPASSAAPGRGLRGLVDRVLERGWPAFGPRCWKES